MDDEAIARAGRISDALRGRISSGKTVAEIVESTRLFDAPRETLAGRDETFYRRAPSPRVSRGVRGGRSPFSPPRVARAARGGE